MVPKRRTVRPLGFRHGILPVTWLLEILGVVSLGVLAVRAWRNRERRRFGAGLLPLLAGYFVVVSIATVSVPRLRAPIDILMILALGIVAGRWQTTSDPVSPKDQGWLRRRQAM